MCGRFNIIDDPLTQLLMQITGQSGWSLTTHYNVAPTEQVPVLRYGQKNDGTNNIWDLSLMRWWLVPAWSTGPSTKYAMFNARAETLDKSRAYGKPFQQQRCIVPVSGYYEWKKEGKNKIPYYLEPCDRPGFAFAGLWDRWQSEDQTIESCTIVTTAATPAMSSIHHRMPVHLDADEAMQWVSGDTQTSELENLLEPKSRTSIRVTPVSTIVNNARNKDDRCTQALGDPVVLD